MLPIFPELFTNIEDKCVFDENVLDSRGPELLMDWNRRRGPWTSRELLNFKRTEGTKRSYQRMIRAQNRNLIQRYVCVRPVVSDNTFNQPIRMNRSRIVNNGRGNN